MSWLVDFVKEKEGFRSYPYLDAVGVPTIGYGATYYADGKRVTMDDAPISEKAATKLLKKHLQGFLDYVLKKEKEWDYDWNNNQIGALTSFIYNLGKSRLKQLTANGTRSNEEIAAKMLLYRKAGGKTLKGLEIRRQEESAHFKK